MSCTPPVKGRIEPILSDMVDDFVVLTSIAISLKRIADALERSQRLAGPADNEPDPLRPGPRGWEVKS